MKLFINQIYMALYLYTPKTLPFELIKNKENKPVEHVNQYDANFRTIIKKSTLFLAFTNIKTSTKFISYLHHFVL